MLSVANVRTAGGAANYFAADNYYTRADADRWNVELCSDLSCQRTRHHLQDHTKCPGVGYGVSDFLASRVAKRVAPVLLVLYSQLLQSVVLLVVVVVLRQPYNAAALGWGTAAGVIGAAGLIAYYQALATGQTAIVAPLASSAPCCRCWST